MNAGAGRLAMGRATAAPRAAPAARVERRGSSLLAGVRARHAIVLLFVLSYPMVATPFLTYQIGAQSLALGLIVLSLTFLGGYGGMISLAQMTVAGLAGYMLAIFGSSGEASISFGWPWWVAAILATAIAIVAGAAIGWLSVRTEGIYTIMITLAMGVAFYYLCLQNYSVFNGFQGFQRVYAPTVLGINFRDPVPFYYLTLACALGGYGLVKYVLRAPFGIALEGIRNNARRMNALGYSVTAHRVAAYAFAALLAAVGGLLFTWYNGLITPNSVGTSWLINVLIIAILGGLRHPIGPFIGAIAFVLLQNFAIDLIDRERFNLVIGGVFLTIVLFSPDGLIGIWAAVKSKFLTKGGSVQ
jgi:branched-chain amino acid transport system permease protein